LINRNEIVHFWVNKSFRLLLLFAIVVRAWNRLYWKDGSSCSIQPNGTLLTVSALEPGRSRSPSIWVLDLVCHTRGTNADQKQKQCRGGSGTRNQHTQPVVVADARPIPLESCGRDVISAPQHSLSPRVQVEQGGPCKQVVIRHCRGGVL
jgi:hypothetical protein